MRNRIDVDRVLCVLTDAGYEPEQLNFYQIRVITKKAMYDWYHTTGSLVLTRHGTPRKAGTVFEVEKLIEAIKVYDHTL